jgi:hypothetical protein
MVVVVEDVMVTPVLTQVAFLFLRQLDIQEALGVYGVEAAVVVPEPMDQLVVVTEQVV